MANLKDLKDCPHGCERTSRSLEVYDERYVRCTVCRAAGPDSYQLTRYDGTTQRRQAAMHLWNCRSSAQMAVLRRELNISREHTREYMKALDAAGGVRDGPVAKAATRIWWECEQDHGSLVHGVEYALVNGTPDREGNIVVEDDDGNPVAVPAKVFGIATELA